MGPDASGGAAAAAAAMRGGEEELSLGQARRLIEAIRKIKHHKQRPSLERITHALGLRLDLVERHLEMAVTKGFILKVRPPALWQHGPPQHFQEV